MARAFVACSRPVSDPPPADQALTLGPLPQPTPCVLHQPLQGAPGALGKHCFEHVAIDVAFDLRRLADAEERERYAHLADALRVSEREAAKMTTLSMRYKRGDFIVTGPDIEPVK